MSLTPSTMAELGSPVPCFALHDYNGKMVTLDDFTGSEALVVMFICNHCPYVKHIQKGLKSLRQDYSASDVAIVGISANSIESHPQDRPELMRETARQYGWTFPYLFDESQAVARAYRAACTPDFFLYDKGRTLVYRGQFDDSRPENGKPVTGRDLRDAIDAVLEHRSVRHAQRPSMGCNIKWKPGNEPGY